MTSASTDLKPRLTVINGGLAPKIPPLDSKKLARVERYLARQAKAAHNLGVRSLERYYNVAYLALRLWRMECFEQQIHPHATKEHTQ